MSMFASDLFPSLVETDDASRPRDRSREGAGKSEKSHIKHRLVRAAVGAQIGAFRLRNKGRILLIDGNAGDGRGVEQPQADLFGDNPSCATAELLVRFAQKDGNADVVLCEKDPSKFRELKERFPTAIVLSDHKRVVHLKGDQDYALWLSDPCGPANHGVEYMWTVGQVMRADFVVVFNEGCIARFLGEPSPDASERTKLAFETMRTRYRQMLHPTWWADTLERKHLARTTEIINGAPNFRYRVLIAANHLAQGATRKPFEVVK